MLIVPWLTTGHSDVKEILHTQSHAASNISGNRDRVLMAIARARAWVHDLIDGRAASFAEIAKREGKVERHIRLLAPLAFVSPRLISDIIDGVASPHLTVTGLAQALASSWAKQECTETVRFTTLKSPKIEPGRPANNKRTHNPHVAVRTNADVLG
jgi:site-specific DNA recombinase